MKTPLLKTNSPNRPSPWQPFGSAVPKDDRRLTRASAARTIHKAKSNSGWTNEDFFRRLFACHPQPMWVYDAQTLRILAVNAAAVTLYGYSREEFIKLTALQLPLGNHETPHPRHLPQHPQSLHRPTIARHRRKDGTPFDIELTTTSVRWHGRQTLAIVGHEITESLQAEHQAFVHRKCLERLLSITTALETAQTLLQAAADLFPWDASRFYLYHAATHEIQSLVHVDTIAGKKVDSSHPAPPCRQPSTLIQQVLQQGPQLIQRDAEAGLPFADPLGDISRSSASLLWVPIQHQSTTVGVLSIQSHTPAAYTPDDLETLKHLANLGAPVLARITTTPNPAADTTAPNASPVLQHQYTSANPPGKTVLVVEDDPFLCELNCAVLRQKGYGVLAAEAGLQAIELVKAGAYIDLLVTDVILPGNMSGRELAQALATLQPGIHVLYTSGYSNGVEDTTFFQREETNFLPKPYDARTLCQRVAECLVSNSGSLGTPLPWPPHTGTPGNHYLVPMRRLNQRASETMNQ